MSTSNTYKKVGERSWADEYARLSSAGKRNQPDPEDLENLAVAAYLIGKDIECIDAFTKAHYEFTNRGKIDRAIRCAFWIGMHLMFGGERARSSGWFARAERLIEDNKLDCVEKGFLLVPAALQSLRKGDTEEATLILEKARKIGVRFNDSDLVTMTLLGSGEANIRQGNFSDGIALLDEAMVAVDSGEVSPVVSGIVYCAVIEMCQKIYDIRRAQEWTSALSRWCDSQPDMVPFRGQCLVRRAEIMQIHGEWPRALIESERACELLTRPPGEPAAGEAFYRQAELYRLRGNFGQAEDLYREAGKRARRPMPGLALLRLEEGQIDAATTAIQNALNEVIDTFARAGMLNAYIEIMLAAGRIEDARDRVDELSGIAKEFGVPYLDAVSSYCLGILRLAEGEAQAALSALNKALKAFDELDAPYESARTRVMTGRAFRELGDEDSATIELGAAQWVFQQLEANPDLRRVEMLLNRTGDYNSFGLTLREWQVLRLLVGGETNKSIAEKLFISERTVDRHVSNIFNKLGVSSRAAATALVYKHRLV